MATIPFTARWFVRGPSATDPCLNNLVPGRNVSSTCCSGFRPNASIPDFDAQTSGVCLEDTRSTYPNNQYEFRCNGSFPVMSTTCSDNCSTCSPPITLGNHVCTYISTDSSMNRWYLLMDQQTCPSDVTQRCPPTQTRYPNGRFLTLPSTLAAPDCKGKTVGDELSLSCCVAAQFEEDVLFFDEGGLCVRTEGIPTPNDTYFDYYTCIDGVPTYTDCGVVGGCSTRVCKTAPYQAIPGKCVYTKPLQGDVELIQWYLLMDYGACACRYAPAPTVASPAPSHNLRGGLLVSLFTLFLLLT